MRGIEARRSDTAPFIAQTQLEALRMMACIPDGAQLTQRLPDILKPFQRCLDDLRAGRIPLPQLLVSQKLSRTLDEYRIPSLVARAAAQLQKVGKSVEPGQRVRFLYTPGKPGVYAWDLPEAPHPNAVDKSRYAELLLRAATTVFQPLGVKKETLRNWIFCNAVYGAPPGRLPPGSGRVLPLWTMSGSGYAELIPEASYREVEMSVNFSNR